MICCIYDFPGYLNGAENQVKTDSSSSVSRTASRKPGIENDSLSVGYVALMTTKTDSTVY